MTKSKLLLSLFFIGFLSLKLSAQKMESIPDSTVEFSVKSLKGIQLKIEAPFFTVLMPFGNGIPYFLNYIDEKRIAPSSTIILEKEIGLLITSICFII